MFDNRHCTYKDLDLLIKETNNIKTNYSTENLTSFLEFVSRFDIEISKKIKYELENEENKEKALFIIDRNIEELKQCVIVDINEHNQIR